MLEKINKIIKRENILTHQNQGITVCSAENPEAGVNLAASILYEVIDRKTVLYLSGGSTPKTLYEKLAKEESLNPGAVGQVDERYGDPYHQNSNQLMIRESGFSRYLEILDIPFYPILQGKTREETAENYDQKIRELNSVFQKNVAIMGIGTDGHTAGMPARNPELRIKNSEIYETHDLVVEYDDMSGKYGERVTMTFLGLEMQDLLILLVFGEDKKEALEMMFESGSEKEVPARFYKRPEIAEKTLLITDQSV